MSPTESPPQLPTPSEKDLPPSSRSKPSGPQDETEAIIAALDEAEVAFDVDQRQAGRLPDSTADVIEILDAEPILTEDEPLAGAPDPVDLVTRRAKNETARDRIAFYESELAKEDRPPRQALLQHEIAVQREQTALDDSDVVQAYSTALSTDAGFRPNLWALRRIYSRKAQWPNVLELLDTEARHAPSKRERAEVWTEKGHILEDLLKEIDEAIICYQTAHELDPMALAPLAALEKVLFQRSTETARPSAELLTVYRGLTNATRDPGRRVALLIELARYEEDVLNLAQPGHSGDLDRVLAYLHDAFDVGIDQMRVIDEIVRLTASFGRIPDCLAALEVKAEILELQAQNATPQRQALLLDQVVAIRRWQTTLARDQLGNGELAWQYLDKAHQRSPGDPLLMPDLMALAESQGRYDQLADLLAQMEESYRMTRGEEPPPLGLWLKRAVALRLAGQDAIADELEGRIATYTPTHLVLLLGRQRRAMRLGDHDALAKLLREEADLALQGLSVKADGERQSDPDWAMEALLNAGAAALRGGNLQLAKEVLDAASQLPKPSTPTPGQLVQQRLLATSNEELLRRSGKWAELVSLYESRLAAGLWTTDATEAQRIHEALIDLHEAQQGQSGQPGQAAEMLAPLIAALPEDLRLRRRAAQISRRSGNGAQEEAALREVERIEGKLGMGSPDEDDLLRRAELLSAAGDGAGAVAIYEQVLRQRPGDAQALDAVEQLLRQTERSPELVPLLKKQIEAAAVMAQKDGRQGESSGERLLGLQAALADVLEHELNQPTQAAPIYRSMLTNHPEYHPALRAMERLYRRNNDLPKQLSALEQLGEALPSGTARATALVQLGEMEEEQNRPVDADSAFARALQSMPLPTPVAAHAALGRLRVMMRQRSYSHITEALEAFGDTLAADEPLGVATSGVLSEERAYWGSQQSGTGVALERSESLLNKALKEVRQLDAAAQPYPELVALLEWSRARVADQRSDGKQQGTALAALASHLASRGDAEARSTVGDLWLRAGLLGGLNEDEHPQQVEAVRRLLEAYRILGDVPQVVVPLCDLIEDLSLAEPLAREPEMIPLLRARQALCPPNEIEDRLLWTLMEADVWLMRCESHDDTVKIDDATRTQYAQEAADAAMRALALDPESVMALLLLRQATAPADSELASDAAPLVATDPTAVRLRAHALYTLRLAGLLSQPEARGELYNEAAKIFQRLGDTESAAASLRTALDCIPHDTAAFGQLLSLLTARADDPKRADAGPLVELINFRLGLSPESDAQRKLEQPLRISLLLQRSGLLLGAGQMAEAIADLQTLLGIDGQHAMAHRRLAELLAQNRQTGEAILHYEQFLQLDTNPAERSAVHIAVARLLSETAPARAETHVRQAIDLDHKYRSLRGDDVTTPDEAKALADLYRWLEQLQLSQGQTAAAIATLRELQTHIPAGASFSEERQHVVLELATVLEKHKDRPGAVAALEKVASAEPLALKVLERLAALSQAEDSARLNPLYTRAVEEARRQISSSIGSRDTLSVEPFHALAQVFAWQKQGDARRLASQSEASLGSSQERQEKTDKDKSVSAEKPPARKMPKTIGAPLRTSAFHADARGVLYELWLEIAESANKLLAPDLKAIGSDTKERLNAKQVPPVWSVVDELAHKFGMGTSDKPYGLYLSRERDLCQLSGTNLVCGSNYSATLTDFPPKLYFRLLRKLALLPDRLGPVDGDLNDLLLLFAACCQLIQLPTPSLPAELKSRLDERTKSLDRALARKERNAMRAMASKLTKLSGDEGRDLVASWRQEVRMGSAQLALAIGGNVPAALSDLGVGPNDSDSDSATMARRLLSFSVSADILTLRRELGVASE